MWQCDTWDGLLQWCETAPSFQRELLIRHAARRRIRELLAPDRLSTVSAAEFTRSIATRGCLRRSDGTPVEDDELKSIRPQRLRQMLEGGRLEVTGNPLLTRNAASLQDTLPGMDDDMLGSLRSALEGLLAAPASSAEEAIDSAAEVEPLTRGLACQVRSLCSRRSCGIHDDVRLMGLHRLRLLIGAGPKWAGATESYDCFDEIFSELMRESREILRDPLAADLLLCRLAQLREPGAWKIAIGLDSSAKAEREALARACIEGGFEAIGPEEADDVNVARLRRLVPGDSVVMHLRGRIGAIGRVTRPYYEVDRFSDDPLDRRWWRRVGVEWIAGDRDYGSLLTGAHQRYSVVELDWECFRAIAKMYRRDPRYDRLFRPLHGSWLLRCDDQRREWLGSLDKPLPLRDRWCVRLGESRPTPGDRVFLYHDGTGESVVGAGTVISDPTPRNDSSGHRLEVIYERLDECALAQKLIEEDPRLGDWRRPEKQVTHLSPSVTTALTDLVGLQQQQHFVLLSRGSHGNIIRSEETYRINGQGSPASRRLRDAVENSRARCLLYHSAPENAFVGFGNVVAAASCNRTGQEESGPGATEEHGEVDLTMQVCRFAEKAGGWSVRGGGLSDGARADGPVPGREALTRTVLPVSEHDFYRVVGAGMSGTENEEQARGLATVADEVGVPLEKLEEMERLLRDRGQMILYGPPGTGKTWLALRLASYLSEGDEARQEIVQFHPAYSYEDFIEGIRPTVVENADGASAVDYPLVRGSFAGFCDRARRNPRSTFVFVVDEINRAQVAAVFGELMLALEYRDREVQLAHARGPDREATSRGLIVPSNVLMLGTMNTADRSTAMVDHALRRRFTFYPLFPDDPTLVQPMFESWLADNAPEARWVAGLLEELNDWLRPKVGRQLLVGPSYFMRRGLDEDTVREIWRFQIRPLLEEYFAGATERLAELDPDDLIWRAREQYHEGQSATSGPFADAPGSEREQGAADSDLRWGGS